MESAFASGYAAAMAMAALWAAIAAVCAFVFLRDSSRRKKSSLANANNSH
jgi:hypothetical protein